MESEHLAAARVAYVRDEALNFEAVVVMDPESGDTLEFQRALVPDAVDLAEGMATYCLVRGGASHYGGIEGWSLHGPTLTVHLGDEAAQVTELPPLTKITLEADDLAGIADHLARILATDD